MSRIKTIGILTFSALAVGAVIVSQSKPVSFPQTGTQKGSMYTMWIKPSQRDLWSPIGNVTYRTMEECTRNIPFKYKRDPRRRGQKLTCCPKNINPNTHLEFCSPPYTI